MSKSRTMGRRELLRSALLGTGAVALRSLATGLPAGVFGAAGLAALDARAAGLRAPQFLLMLTSNDGNPLNCNAPGTYDVPGIDNNPNATMAPTALTLGGVSTTAAAPWATLPQWALDRTAVVHHRTYQNAHPQYAKVMGLVGSGRASDGTGTAHLTGIVASELADRLGTVQRAPIRMGPSEEVIFDGRPVQRIRPSTLADVFSTPDDDLGLDLAALRATAIDDIYQMVKERGTPGQATLVDTFATSRDQVRNLDRTLVDRLGALDGDGAQEQLDAALTLFLMNLTPVVTVNVGFGGDNHGDDDLTDESSATVDGMGLIGDFLRELDGTPLRDRVVVANLDVFGRTLRRKSSGGRDHNLNHHAMMMIGSAVNAGVYGAVAESGNDFGATAIDAASGLGVEGGDIPESETLEAAAKTLCTVCGLDAEAVERRIVGGQAIRAITG